MRMMYEWYFAIPGDSTAHLNAKSECLPFCDDENCFGNCSPTANARTTRSRAADLNINVDWQMTMLRSEDEESLLVTIMSDVPSKVEVGQESKSKSKKKKQKKREATPY